MTDYQHLLPIAIQAIELAHDLVKQPVKTVTVKSDRDMVTDVDYNIERTVRRFLQERTPDIGFLGEEDGIDYAATSLMWALDPVDGTANFTHGLPLHAVSLGLMHGTRSVLGVIDLPQLNSRYTAAEGSGAFENGQPIHASQVSALDQAVVAIGDYALGPTGAERNKRRLRITAELSARAQRVRMFGSAAIDLAWLAAGRIDGSIMLSNNPWDTCAGVAIAREAGAVVMDDDGSEHTAKSRATVAAAPHLREQILALVNESCLS
ncbi:inositol monophosphatase family protein [Dactylosporangium sp. NPDC050688]|uniref:inositol monophosphatase family protein n=1 Tax=Dactylosporangium sp. NPDC050688 TaxID=3157217 RepID=UPI0033C4481C